MRKSYALVTVTVTAAAGAALAIALPDAAATPAGSAASSPSVDLLRAFKPVLPRIRKSTAVPVLLPASMPMQGSQKVYASGSATRAGFDLELSSAPNCGGADACFVASFLGAKGKKLPLPANARLSNGDSALFRNSSCGGSCSPASLWFVHRGVLYSWQNANVPARTARALLFRLADEAVAAGPR